MTNTIWCKVSKISQYSVYTTFVTIHMQSNCSAAAAAAAAAKLPQSCPTLCDPIDSSPPGSPVPGILQARTLEWVAISISNAWKWKVKVKSLSCARLLVTPWTAAHQAPPSMRFSRQEYWSGVPLPSPKLLYINAIQFCVVTGKSKQFKCVLNIIPMARGLCTDDTTLLQIDLWKMKRGSINKNSFC